MARHIMDSLRTHMIKLMHILRHILWNTLIRPSMLALILMALLTHTQSNLAQGHRDP